MSEQVITRQDVEETTLTALENLKLRLLPAAKTNPVNQAALDSIELLQSRIRDELEQAPKSSPAA